MANLQFRRAITTFLLIALVFPLWAQAEPEAEFKPLSSTNSLDSPILIGVGAIVGLVGGVLLVQSYPLKAEANSVFAKWVAGEAAENEKNDAADAFNLRYWTGLGLGIAGVIVTFVGIAKGHNDMDYIQVPPPVENFSLSLEGNFIGLRIRH